MSIEDHLEENVAIPLVDEHSGSEMQEAILVPEAVLVSRHDVDALPEQVILAPEAVVLSHQDFAEVCHLVQENPHGEVEETVPLVFATLSPIEELDAIDGNGRIDTAHHILDRLLSMIRLTDRPRN